MKEFVFGTWYNVTVNLKAEIVEWCNLHKGVTIGQQNGRRLREAPRMGNHVWIGVKAKIVGKVEICDDVLIAPGAYVN